MNAKLRTILFGLFASPLAAGAGPAAAEVELELISGFPFVAGQAANGNSIPRHQSADGRFVALQSEANNLQPGIVDANNDADAYVFDRQTGLFDLITRCAANSAQACADFSIVGSAAVMVSDDGRWVAYDSENRGLIAGGTYPGSGSNKWQVYLFDRTDRVTRLVSHLPGDATTASDSDARLTGLSADGRWLTFHSAARNLAGPTNNFTQTYLYDRTTGESVMISHAAGAPATPGNGASTARELSPDGRFVLLQSAATQLIAGQTDTTNSADTFVYDRQSGTIELVSRDAADPLLAAGGTPRDLSPDGRFVLLDSPGVALAAGLVDANGTGFDTFVFDRQTGTAQLASHSFKPEISGAATGTTGHRLSDDGRFSYFTCNGANLIDGFVDNNGGSARDVFAFDRTTGEVTLVSHAAGSGTQGANAGVEMSTLARSLSPDGRHLLLISAATNLQSEVSDLNAASDLFLADRLGDTRLLSRVGASAAAGAVAGTQAWLENDLSAVFASRGLLDPAAPDPYPGLDLFRFDAAAAAVSLLSATPLSAAKAPLPKDSHPGPSYGGSIDRSGRWVVWGPYLWDRNTGALERYLHAAGLPGNPANTESAGGRATPDGRFVSFSTAATNIAAVTDTNGQRDVYFYDRNVDTAFLVSHAAGSPATTASRDSALAWSADDARQFVFESAATNLIPAMTGISSNLYYYDRAAGVAELISHGFASLTESGNYSSSFEQIALDRSWLVLSSGAENLVPNFVDHNNYFLDLQAQESPEGLVHAPDLYYYDRAARQSTLITRRPGTINDGSAGIPYFRVRATADGASVFYSSQADDLVPGQTPLPDNYKIYRWNRATNSNELVVTPPGQPTVPCSGSVQLGDITPDGRWVLFASSCGLVAGDLDNSDDVYLLDRQSGLYQLISHLPGLPTTPSGRTGEAHSISEDGRRILYSTGSFLHSYDRSSGQATLLGFAYYDPQKPIWADGATSADGTRVLMVSDQSDLTPYDANGRSGSGHDYFLVTLPGLFADGFESGSAGAWSLVLP